MLVGQVEHPPRSCRARLESFNRVREVVDRAGKRGQVHHPVYFAGNCELVADIQLEKLEAGLALEMRDVFAMPCDQIVKSDNLVSGLNQPVTKM